MRLRLFPWLILLLAACGGSAPADRGPAPGGSVPPPTPTASASPLPSSLRFFTFGDWGTGTPSQLAVAAAVRADCQAKGCDFGLLLGDNFYPMGVSSTTDSQWQTKFEDVYTGLDLPFYAILGNHDVDGNEQAEIDYTSLQGRWKMPARQYTVAFPDGAGGTLLEIFVIDSDLFDAAAAQQLHDALAASAARWKLLALHHPLYSNGTHGDNSAGINALLLPEICDKIDAVLSGHDHLFSHLDEPADGCAFPQFVIGTGGKDLYPANPDPRALYSESSWGFAAITVDAASLRLEFRHSDGSLAYSTQLTQ